MINLFSVMCYLNGSSWALTVQLARVFGRPEPKRLAGKVFFSVAHLLLGLWWGRLAAPPLTHVMH